MIAALSRSPFSPLLAKQGGCDDPSIMALARRIQRAAEIGRGIRFEAADLDLLVAIGVNDLIQTKAAESTRELCRNRDARSRSTSAVNSSCPQPLPGGSSKSTGMTQAEAANDAFQRARRTSRQPSASWTGAS